MKKSMLVALVMAFLMFMASSYGFAQQVTGLADTTKEGSLLIWPLVQTNDNNETYIMIVNSVAGDGNDTPLNLQCYWEVKEDPTTPASTCDLSDFLFYLSANNPIIFQASNGAGLDGIGRVPGIGFGHKGALKCWAVDATDTAQIAWNHLSGAAIICDSNETLTSGPVAYLGNARKTAFQYNAWRFAANVVDASGQFVDGYWVGKTVKGGALSNTLSLAGAVSTSTTAAGCTAAGLYPVHVKQFPTNQFYCVTQVSDPCVGPPNGDFSDPACKQATAVYDGCPTYLTFDFLAEPSAPAFTDGWARNALALLPCKEDLRYDNTDDPAFGTFDFPTRLSFTVWNENEIKYTGTQKCANCDFEGYLGQIAVNSVNYFQALTLHTSSGRFRVDGLAGGKCTSPSPPFPAKATPLLGVMATKILRTIDPTSPGMKSRDLVATNPTGSNTPAMNSAAGYIRWDPGSVGPEKKRR